MFIINLLTFPTFLNSMEEEETYNVRLEPGDRKLGRQLAFGERVVCQCTGSSQAVRTCMAGNEGLAAMLSKEPVSSFTDSEAADAWEHLTNTRSCAEAGLRRLLHKKG